MIKKLSLPLMIFLTSCTISPQEQLNLEKLSPKTSNTFIESNQTQSLIQDYISHLHELKNADITICSNDNDAEKLIVVLQDINKPSLPSIKKDNSDLEKQVTELNNRVYGKYFQETQGQIYRVLTDLNNISPIKIIYSSRFTRGDANRWNKHFTNKRISIDLSTTQYDLGVLKYVLENGTEIAGTASDNISSIAYEYVQNHPELKVDGIKKTPRLEKEFINSITQENGRVAYEVFAESDENILIYNGPAAIIYGNNCKGLPNPFTIPGINNVVAPSTNPNYSFVYIKVNGLERIEKELAELTKNL